MQTSHGGFDALLLTWRLDAHIDGDRRERWHHVVGGAR